MQDLKTLYEQRFLPVRDADWFQRYMTNVDVVRHASEASFRSSEFQRDLWEIKIFGIGPGEAVTVHGAYTDPEVIEALWRLRNDELPTDPHSRAKFLSDAFARILTIVTPRYNYRRPSARLVRIFAVMFPGDVLCLMDAGRTTQVSRWLGVRASGFNFIGQQTLMREAIRLRVGAEHSLADQVSHSIFVWFLLSFVIVVGDTGLPGRGPTHDSDNRPDVDAGSKGSPRSDRPGGVFVVHGHDMGPWAAVARFLDRLGLKPVILHEQANLGQTIIEKVEAYGDVKFAVVLLTPDDVGSKVGGELQARPRQNVVLELGYFIGRLGRRNVCALHLGTMELPTDFAGVAWHAFDQHGGWHRALGGELKAAGFNIDWNKVME